MKDSLSVVQQKIARIRSLVPQDDAKEYVVSMLDQRLGEGDDRAMGIVPQPFLANQKLLASARFSAENLDQPTRLLSRPEGIVDLGTIEWCLRPALPMRNGRFSPPRSPPWDNLRADEMMLPASRVCRIDMGFANSEPFHLGTGFVLGNRKQDKYAIVTNAHVVSEAVRLGWPTDGGLSLYCDFDRTSVIEGGTLHQLSAEYSVHNRYDLAVLYLSASDDLKFLEQHELHLSPKPPDPTLGARIGVLGHPHFDSRRDPFPQHFGFGEQYGIKRFSPGLIRATEERRWLEHDVEVFLHDASTLSGSSGSCIVSLDTKEVLGLHFGGWPVSRCSVPTPAGDLLAQLFEANGAVPLWQLVDDPIFDHIK